MIKNKKVKKMMLQNNIERQNYTLVIRLKGIIECLNKKIEEQDDIIISLKKDSKATKINQMEVEIQHLNDQNKRLTLLVQDLKSKGKTVNACNTKKPVLLPKPEEKKYFEQQNKIQNKFYQILKENQSLKKQLIGLKINETMNKKRNSAMNDRNSIQIQKNMLDYEKLNQKKLDLEAEQSIMQQKIRQLQLRIAELQTTNHKLTRSMFEKDQQIVS